MIIDIHTHYGMIPGRVHMPVKILLEAMKQKGISYALVSNIECGILHDGINGNLKMLDIVRSNRDNLGCMLWACENMDERQKEYFQELYLKNQDIVKGIKIHPDLSLKRADDECFDFFYSMAGKYSLPVLIHTNDNLYSSLESAVNVAKKHFDTTFILGHMVLGSDGVAALRAMNKYDNLYGDTAWVDLEIVNKAAEMGVVHKMMFGTDSPINGTGCYEDACYIEYYSCHADYMKGIMADNAKRLFNI